EVAPTSGIADELQLILPPLREKLARQTRLEQMAEEARRNAASERWQAAAAQYETLLREPDVPAQQREAWQASLARCRDEAELAELFDAATLALAQEQRGGAREERRETRRRPPGRPPPHRRGRRGPAGRPRPAPGGDAAPARRGSSRDAGAAGRGARGPRAGRAPTPRGRLRRRGRPRRPRR